MTPTEIREVTEALRREIAELRCENKDLRCENAALRAENSALRAEVTALRRRLDLDSSTSSKPPSDRGPFGGELLRPPGPGRAVSISSANAPAMWYAELPDASIYEPSASSLSRQTARRRRLEILEEARVAADHELDERDVELREMKQESRWRRIASSPHNRSESRNSLRPWTASEPKLRKQPTSEDNSPSRGAGPEKSFGTC